MSTGRAPGKVLLLGEHSVVYGHPALAAAIPRYVTVTVELAAESKLLLPGIPAPPELLQAVEALAREAGFAGSFLARVESEIPLGSGLGSSAALGVALARAFKPGCTPGEAMSLAMHLERVLHGAPSGVDPAACAYGGIIDFVRGDPPRIEQVETPHALWLCVALTGLARGTHTTVLPLAERRKTDGRVDEIFEDLHELVDDGWSALTKSALPELGRCMDRAHALLRELGVSCAELDERVAALKAAGALGAKLTGAGGGGAAIGLARGEQHAREIALAVGGFAVQAGAA